MRNVGFVCLQTELERDTDTLKKEIIDIRLLAQRDIVLDPQAEILEVPHLPYTVRLSVSLSVCLSVHVSVCLSDWLSVCLSDCTVVSAYPSIFFFGSDLASAD